MLDCLNKLMPVNRLTMLIHNKHTKLAAIIIAIIIIARCN